MHSPWESICEGTDTRFDSILAGCVLAVVANPQLGDRVKWLTKHAAGLLWRFPEETRRVRALLRDRFSRGEVYARHFSHRRVRARMSNSEFHNRGAASAFVLRRFGYGHDVRVL